ncbi:MAG: hypothetical protein II007_00630 [Gammaproteobacteria bacterium]|nr:hypothetical protein [Gammaproteobacteria bacterium]
MKLLVLLLGGMAFVAMATDCPYPLTPLEPLLRNSPEVIAIAESSSVRDRGAKELEGRAAIRTSIHFNDDSTAHVEQQGYTKNCDGITYTIRIDFPSFDEAAYKKSVKRLYWLLEPTLVVANWRKHNLDYQPQFATWTEKAAQKPGQDTYFSSQVTWPNQRGDVISFSIALVDDPSARAFRQAMVLWIGIGPEVDVGEGD